MKVRKALIGAVIMAGGALSSVAPASATPAGNPPTMNACMGMFTAYGDHPEASPAFFAKYVDQVSVQTLMGSTRGICFAFR